MKNIPQLITERLLLRPFALADAAVVRTLAGDYSVAHFTGNIPHPYPEGAAESWIGSHQKRFDAGEAMELAVTLRQSAELIGAICLTIKATHHHAEMGYWIGKPYWGQGYCTEAGRALLRYGFGTLGLHRIHAGHYARNPASGRVMQKLGMTCEGLRRQHIRKWDRFEDLVEYGVLADEFARQ